MSASNKSLQPAARLRASHQSFFDEVEGYPLGAAEFQRCALFVYDSIVKFIGENCDEIFNANQKLKRS